MSNQAELPLVRVNSAASRPPVHDSAQVTVRACCSRNSVRVSSVFIVIL